MSTVEKRLEADFCRWCQSKQIVPIKGPVVTSKGFPDRFVQLPNGGGTIYVEFKGTSYYDLTPLQVWWKNYLLASNPHRYFLVATDEELAFVKQRCELFISLGPELINFEKELLNKNL